MCEFLRYRGGVDSPWTIVLRQAVALVLLFAAASARGGVLASDDFSYPDGSLDQRNGGAGSWVTQWVASTFGGGISVTGGVARGAVFGNPPKYAVRAYSNPQSTRQLFVALDFSTPASIELNDYFGMTLYIGANGAAMSFGKTAGSNRLQIGNGGIHEAAFDLQPNVSYHLIAAYDIRHVLNGDLDRVTLWIDPDATDYYDVTTGVGSGDVTGFDLVSAHAQGLYFQTETVESYGIDNLVISDDPIGVGLAVPEPGTAGLFGIGAFGLVLGERRRRASHRPACAADEGASKWPTIVRT